MAMYLQGPKIIMISIRFLGSTEHFVLRVLVVVESPVFLNLANKMAVHMVSNLISYGLEAKSLAA
jgi:hypothetical protein